MHKIQKSIVIFILLFTVSGISHAGLNKHTKFVSLSGKALSTGNKVSTSGSIVTFQPLVHIVRTKSTVAKGTILLLPDGGYETLNLKKETSQSTSFLNSQGFDVAILEYHVGKGMSARNLALKDALNALQFIKTNQLILGLNTQKIAVFGIGSGGHLAARAVQRLAPSDQPDDVILISPSYLNETLPGSVFPAVMPPLTPKSRLFVSANIKEKADWKKSAQEYSKMWIGYDGVATFRTDSDSVSVNSFAKNSRLVVVIKKFIDETPAPVSNAVNPAAIPVQGYNPGRHAYKLEFVAKNKYDLILIGNSITHNFEKQQYQPVWNQFFAPRNALNLGFSGYRTENLLWNIEHGELQGQSPKVAILEIGTNNIDEKNYPTRHTASQLAGGIEAIVKLMRAKMPDTKIIIMRCFPGCYGGPNPTSHRIILERDSDIVSKLADGKHIFYCDVNHVFLNMDGSINHDMMPDWLHPSPTGAKAWAQAMEPLLSQLMGDKSLDTDIPANTAIVPVPKLEENGYDWWGRHAEIVNKKDSIDPEIVLIGNSITHFWAGFPVAKKYDGKAIPPNGPKAWNDVFMKYRVLNMGFGWDRSQNVLWRLDHGELDGLHPRAVILHIGTNNTSETANARKNTALEIAEGVKAVCMRVRSKVPTAKIVLMAIFPREESPTNPRRLLINEVNGLLSSFAKENNICLIDLAPKMLSPDGTLSKQICNDFCHPTEKGYQIWADAIRSEIEDY